MSDRKTLVYVLAKDGSPLMPCEPVIARLLLKQGKAKVKRREPFIIKLLYESTHYTQPLTLGVDTGSGTFGAAVAGDNGSVVYASEVTVRNDVHVRMEQRKEYRRTRRGRKTRHRKPGFANRRNSRRKDRFSPTMVSKLRSHEKEIEFVCSILPVTRVVIEGGTFDPHLLKNPALRSPKVRPWGYQKGLQYGFENMKAAVRARDRHTCQLCGESSGKFMSTIFCRVRREARTCLRILSHCVRSATPRSMPESCGGIRKRKRKDCWEVLSQLCSTRPR